MTAQFAAETALETNPLPQPECSTYAVEVVADHSAEALLRVLNPLQKLEITPHSVRSGKSWSGESMVVEVQFDATPERAEQVRRQMGACILVERVELMACSR
ncbi:MAG: hypothetical protein AAGI06_17185 [Pseudomonadota bacterium]